ncbi:OmpA family protein [Phenylobacterium immobile]|uniref:OmpA family protein n=1 Tax=Phenylobacterium immobile TaxID=21 RepID=UPI000A9E3AFF|nr:OmpA family protein [Phenylobacterium immobile]
MNHSTWIGALSVMGGGLLLTACATSSSVVKAPATCGDQAVQIYFEPDSADVTSEGMAVLRQAATMTKGCTIDKIQVEGLADAAGAPAANLVLSERRAQSVNAALTQVGLPRADFVGAAGDAGALNAQGQARPLRRRTDIQLRLSPKS